MQVLDLQCPEFRRDPHPTLARLREAGPLCRVEPYGAVGVTRYDDVVRVLKDPQLYSSAGMNDAFPPLPGAELFSSNRTLIGQDPPQHTKVRRLIQRAFTLPEMSAWEPRVAELTERLVATSLRGKQVFDLIADFAMPLPVTVIAAMLGVDPEHGAAFKRWSDDMVSVRVAQLHPDPAYRERRRQEIVRSCDEFKAYFEQVIAARREHPGDDLVSAIVQAADEGQILQADQILSLTRLMLVAGNETTTNLLGNAMTALLGKAPDQWQRLVAEPELAGAAVEEALRFDGPVIHLFRRVTEPTELCGTTLAPGTLVAPLLASANRDPRKFPDPDRFDLGRAEKGHVAFGLGVHLCVGAPLARIETRLALAALAREFPDLALTDETPRLLDSFTLRGHKSLTLVRRGAASERMAAQARPAAAHV